MENQTPALLSKIIALLVEQWGIDQVKSSIEIISQDCSPLDYNDQIDHEADVTFKKERKSRSNTESRRTTTRVSAMKFFSSLDDVTGEKRRILGELAYNFDDKKFLPTLSDVRYFMSMIDIKSEDVRERVDAVKPIFNRLKQFSADQINRIAVRSSYLGRAELAPLSDAIKSVGRSRHE